MLRNLREQRWYLFFWVPFSTLLGLLAVWLWIMAPIIGGWTFRYDEAPKWGFASVGVLGFLVLFLIFMFPRKPARRVSVAAASVGLTALALCLLYLLNTTVITYEVKDVDGGPLKDITIAITHHANGVALTGPAGDTVLRTDEQGKASIRIFKSEECDAHVNDRLGHPPGYGNSNYSDDNAFFISASAQERAEDWPWGNHDAIEHSYMLEFQNGLPYIPQRCMESPLTSGSGVVHVYLRRSDSLTLPPYFDQIIKQESNDPAFKTMQLMSLGGSIESFNHLDELLSALSHEGSQQDAVLYSLDLLALQIRQISTGLSGLSLDVNIPQRRYLSTNDQRQKCSQILYIWLSGSNSPPPLSHTDRIAYIQQRMDQATIKLIDALHPVMLKKKAAYRVLGELQQNARPAMKFYPEVFEKGTDEAREGALEVLSQIVPSAEQIAFLIRSKHAAWIERASGISFNSTAAELSDDLKILETLKAQESDTQNIAAFEQVIKLARDRLARDQLEEADKPVSTVEPRYVVIDLGTKILHPKKITNSGYVLGRDESSYYVWFDGTTTKLQPKNAGGLLTVDDIDESGTVVGTETDPSGGAHHSVYRATWEKGINPPMLSEMPTSKSEARPGIQDQLRGLNLPQIANSVVVPRAMNDAVAPMPLQDDQPASSASLTDATQVIGNGPGGGYLWEMPPTLSATKTFEGPYLINILLPGEPKISPWNVTSVASINDGGSIVGTAIYKQNGPNDPLAAGSHCVMLMPLAIVREAIIGGGDFEPIMDNGLDDNASIPIFGSAPPGTPNASNPTTDGQGIFYIQMPGSITASITLRSGDNHVTVQATPVKGRPNLLRTGKLVMIEHGDPFRAPDITTIEAGPQNNGVNPTLELQKYGRTIVK